MSQKTGAKQRGRLCIIKIRQRKWEQRAEGDEENDRETEGKKEGESEGEQKTERNWFYDSFQLHGAQPAPTLHNTHTRTPACTHTHTHWTHALPFSQRCTINLRPWSTLKTYFSNCDKLA